MNDLSTVEIARIVEFTEAEAFADMYTAAPVELGCRVERIGSAFVFIAPSLPITFFNRVIGLGLNETTSESMLTEIARLYSDAKIPSYALQISPAAQPTTLPDWLQAKGLVQQDNWSKVYRKPDINIHIPTDLRIENIGQTYAADFAHIVVDAFKMPPFLQPWLMNLVGRTGWQQYLAFDDQTAVSAGTLFIKNNMAWLGIAGTLTSHRKRGGQGGIMAQRIRAAAQAGCDWVITETDEDRPNQPNPSYHNMIRAGFTLAYQRTNYVYQQTS